MKVILENSKVKLKKTVAAIGIFDGLHRGHQFLLKRMMAKAKTLHAKSMVITFYPHPAHVLRPDVKLDYLVSFFHRLKLLDELGVDICCVIPFTKKFAKVKPEAFIKEVLVKRLGVKAVFVGSDFRFGRDRAGDVELFKKLSKECDYEMLGVKALKSSGEAISSTRIRRLISEGHLTKAAGLLGRPFSVIGQVVKGQGRGKGLGYPTANVSYGANNLPPNGVYAVKILLNKKVYKGAANLGFRPSFNEKITKPNLEVFIFDLKRNLYGKTLEVVFIKKIRDELKFEDLQSLIVQIQSDVQKARRILKIV